MEEFRSFWNEILGLEFRVSELGLYCQIEKKCFTKI